jgi:hypothetical protein
MKKIFLTLAIIFGGLVSAQDYYDTYPNEYNGYEYYDNSYDYPDDYYYNYPTDYYPDQYYQGYYNDYRQAVFSVNWNQFFVQYRLTPFQIDQILALNNRFASYAAWNAYYGWNPDRWYYDRFYALQNILGPRIFVVYQNNYFRGRSPIVFYKTRFTNFYARRYPVRPVYRNVNINVYKIDRRNFEEGFRNVGRNQGMINPTRNDGVRNDNTRSGSNGNIGGIKNPRNEGVRTNDGNIRTQNDNIRNNGIHNENPRNLSNGNNLGGIRNPRSENVRTNENVGIRNQGGIRQNQNSERRIENRGNNGNQRNSAPRSENSSRNSGNRLVSR